MISQKPLNMLLASAVALTVAGTALSASANDVMTPEKEKCYGVVKAGQNDCAAADDSHSCAASASADGSGQEWIAVPKGLCEKLVNGSLAPVSAAAPEAAAPADDTAAPVEN